MVEDKATSHQTNPTSKPRSLLRKYEIPIDQLSYEYIGTCNDVKQLERTVIILRSGEEGYFPDLQRTAEDRLRLLNLNSRQLRDEQPVLTRSNMTKEEWTNIATELETWKMEVAMKDLKLKEDNNGVDDSYLPPIRHPPAANNTDKSEASTQNRCVRKRAVSDYATWDKYDPDVELLKMDLDEERAAENSKANKNEAKPVGIEARLAEVRRYAENLSETERRVLAEEKKNQGNEYYKAYDYVEAVNFYSESLELWPNPNAYNNRAECNLKLCKYEEALADANSSLSMQKKNVKARFRRGLAHRALNKIDEALIDMRAVLRLEPNNSLALKIRNQLRLKLQCTPRTLRIMEEDESGKRRIVEMSEIDVRRDGLREGQYEVTRMGLPKIMCDCTDHYSKWPITAKLNRIPVRDSMDVTEPKPKIVEIIDEPEVPKPMSSTRIAVTKPKPKIVEIIDEPEVPKPMSSTRMPVTEPKPKIVEIIDEPEVPKTKSSTRMPIIEVNKMEVNGNYERKIVVIDKRTKITSTKDINLTNRRGDSENN